MIPYNHYEQSKQNASLIKTFQPFDISNKSLTIKEEPQYESKLISYERAFKMLKSDMYITGIVHAIPQLLRFKVDSGNYERVISLFQKFCGNMRLKSRK